MKKQILFICCAVIAYCLSACNTAPQQAPLKEKNLPKHVILIGFDGLSAHCLNNGADMPTFRKMMAEGASIYPIISTNVQTTDSRFGDTTEFISHISDLTGNPPILKLEDAEPIGPQGYLDILLIAPCTGNTLAKLANGITDTPVLMAAKAHLRNSKPLVISISTNDALGINFKNIGQLFNIKNIYFVPFGQDNAIKKPNSMIARTDQIVRTLEEALEGKQIQPVIL